jgi:hypothetical protein
MARDTMQLPTNQTHVALDARLTTTEADALLYWLDRLAAMIDKQVMTPRADMDRGEQVALIRRVAKHAAEQLNVAA